jgi:hypothetical protein
MRIVTVTVTMTEPGYHANGDPMTPDQMTEHVLQAMRSAVDKVSAPEGDEGIEAEFAVETTDSEDA